MTNEQKTSQEECCVTFRCSDVMERIMALCGCGCGGETQEASKEAVGEDQEGKNDWISRITALCDSGCGGEKCCG